MFAAKDAIEHYERARSLLAEEEVRIGVRRLVEPSIPELERLYTQLGRAYEALLLHLEEARRVHEEALELSGPLGPQFEVSSFIRLRSRPALPARGHGGAVRQRGRCPRSDPGEDWCWCYVDEVLV